MKLSEALYTRTHPRAGASIRGLRGCTKESSSLLRGGAPFGLKPPGQTDGGIRRLRHVPLERRSARQGGLSAAIEAGVEEVILYLQSRHSPERVARRYMHIREQELLLLLIFDVFGL